MKITEQDLGRLVSLPVKTDWGPGIILKVGNGFAQIQFRNCPDPGLKKYRCDENPLLLSAMQTDPKLNFLDLSAPGKKKKIRGPRPQLDFNQALERFQTRFPGGFADPAYLGDLKTCTRLALADASRFFGEMLGEQALGRLLANWNINVIAGKMAECAPSLRLLSQDLPGAFQALLKDPARAFSYFDAFHRVLQDPSVSFNSMNPYFDNIKAGRAEGIGTWGAATALLFLAQPQRHLFVRPNMIKRFTQTLGRRLNDTTAPNWETYYALTRVAGEYLEKLRPLGASDMIDVYLFFRLAHQDAVEKTAV
jgi:hypothetical protein